MRVRNDEVALGRLLFEIAGITEWHHEEKFVFEGQVSKRQKIWIETEPLDEEGQRTKDKDYQNQILPLGNKELENPK